MSKLNDIEIIKSKIDHGEYKLVKLDNGILIMINNDLEVQNTAVSVVVNTGFYNDPLEFQGLSHFLEHMLFMGSENYPNVNEFEKYVSENGGSFNAVTEEETTTYYFKVITEKIDKLLDIFSSFFICPLFDEK